jgi:heme exporter protein CcmD
MDWSQGGYGFYVWGAYLFALLAIGGEVVALTRRKKQILEQRKSAGEITKGRSNETTS